MADREFLLKIVGDVSQAQKSIGTLEKDVSGFKSTAGNIGKAVVGAVAVDQIVGAGKAVVGAASDQEQALGALRSVYGDYATDMEKFGDTTAEALGISKAEFSQLAAITGSQLKNAGVPMDEVASSTQAMAERAADLAAMYGGTVPEAMAAMSSALKGEMDPMEKYAVTMKASSIEAKAIEMGLTDAEGKVTDYGKAMATQALIMEQSSDAAGTFAKESGTLAGQQAIMSAQMKDTQAQIGNMLMPTIIKLSKVLMELITFVKNNSSWLFPLAAGIMGVVLAVKAWQVAQAAWGVATKVATAAQWLFNAAMAANPIVLIIIAVAALAAGFVLLYMKVDWFREAVDKAVGAILKAFEWLYDWIKKNWPLLLSILAGPFGIAAYTIIKNWDKISGFFRDLPGKIAGWLSSIVAKITGPFSSAKDTVLTTLGNIGNWFRDLPGRVGGWFATLAYKVTSPFNTAKANVMTALNSIQDWFRGFPGRVVGFFSNLANIIKAPYVSAFNAIKRLWNSTVGGFSFKVPSWVPGMGGKGWSIPKMAAGGIVTRPTIALIGEAGPEAVVPLSKGGGLGGTTIINVYALTASAEVGRKVYEALKEYERTSGKAVA